MNEDEIAGGEGPPALSLEGIVRRYRQGADWLTVLRGADLVIEPGEIVALVGPSGAGKSTLLHMAGLLERPDRGRVRIGGLEAGKAPEAERTALRRTEIGFVYQFHHLLPEFSAIENVMLPQLVAGRPRKAAFDLSMRLLQAMGLGKRSGHRPAELSGGEQQRVAICRAVANRPRLLLADEPTGNLDPSTAEQVFQSLLRLVRNEGVAALIATHDTELANRMDRIVGMEDGKLTERARMKKI